MLLSNFFITSIELSVGLPERNSSTLGDAPFLGSIDSGCWVGHESRCDDTSDSVWKGEEEVIEVGVDEDEEINGL
jgi:hypothetical protein